MKKVTFEAIKDAIPDLPEEQRAALKNFVEAFSDEQFEQYLASLLRSIQRILDPNRKEAIERLRQRARPLPPGFKFDRLEAHER